MHAQKRRRTRVPPFVVRPPFSPHRCVYDNTCVFIDGELRRCLISNPFDGLFNMCFHSNAIWAFVYCPLFFSFLHSSSLFSLYLFSAIVFFVLNCCFQPRMVQNDFQFYLFLFFCDRSGRSFAMLIISLSFFPFPLLRVVWLLPYYKPRERNFLYGFLFSAGHSERLRGRKRNGVSAVVTTRMLCSAEQVSTPFGDIGSWLREQSLLDGRRCVTAYNLMVGRLSLSTNKEPSYKWDKREKRVKRYTQYRNMAGCVYKSRRAQHCDPTRRSHWGLKCPRTQQRHKSWIG